MCLRTVQGYHTGKVKNKYLTLTKLQQKINDIVTGLDKVLFCGVLGDPAACKDLLAMIEWILDKSPNCTIGINTNGALQDTAWWKKLAKLTKYNIKSYVVFSIDGLEDTNHIYRVGVNWDKLIENATAFINAGGSAHWDMLVFKHNEHQVKEAKQLAEELKFKFFRTKVSSRFDNTSKLEPPTGHKLEWKNVNFSCMAQDTNSLYLSAEGYWYPCCYTHAAHEEKYDATWGKSISNFVDRNQWDNLITNPPKVCTRSCGTTYNKGQWTGEWQFNV
jgi:molybdenum cofactor biosynthesis enzyme MoaA